MTTITKKYGFSAVLGLIIIAVIALGVVGFKLMAPKTDDTPTAGSDSASMPSGEEVQQNTGATPDAVNPPPDPAPASLTDIEEPPMEVFDITAKNFSFSVVEIRVRKGGRVKINLKVGEGLHDWVVDELDARTIRAGGGSNTSVEFVADKAGTFEYYCSVGSHRQMGMVGT